MMDSFLKQYKYQVIILLLVLFNIGIVVKNQEHYFISEYAMATSNEEKKVDIETEHQHKIRVYYPTTDYELLNHQISDTINQYIIDFKKSIKDAEVQPNQYYTLTIFYDYYHHQNYISYVFYIETYTGGAHPNHQIWTISYDTEKEKVVTLEDLIATNDQILTIFSEDSREQLLRNSKIVDMGMMMDGTLPKKENFSNFAFSKEGLLLFFPQYQVAPYSSGSFVVTIPYQKIFPI